MKLGPKAFPKLFPKQTNTHTLSNSATSLLNSRRRHHSGTRCNQCPKRQDRTGTASDGGNGVGRQETASDDKKQRRTAGSRKLVSQQQRRRRITTRSRRNSPKHVQKARRHEDVEHMSARFNVQARTVAWTGQNAGTTCASRSGD